MSSSHFCFLFSYSLLWSCFLGISVFFWVCFLLWTFPELSVSSTVSTVLSILLTMWWRKPDEMIWLVLICTAGFIWFHFQKTCLIGAINTKSLSNTCPLVYSGCWAMLSQFSHVQFCATQWTVTLQAPLNMDSSRQEYWSGLPFPSPEDLPDPGVEPASLKPHALAGKLFLTRVINSKTWCICLKNTFHLTLSKWKHCFCIIQ